jgi:hypothetical protein
MKMDNSQTKKPIQHNCSQVVHATEASDIKNATLYVSTSALMWQGTPYFFASFILTPHYIIIVPLELWNGVHNLSASLPQGLLH